MPQIGEITADDLFEAISHPLRIRILKTLVKRPMRFAELKRRFEIKSSGGLDFHLRKLNNLIATNKDGCYRVTIKGIAALKAINVVQKRGIWQRKAYYISLTACLILGAHLAFTNDLPLLFVMFLGTVLWMAFLPCMQAMSIYKELSTLLVINCGACAEKTTETLFLVLNDVPRKPPFFSQTIRTRTSGINIANS